MDDLGEVLRGSWGRGCWCMHPRQLGTSSTPQRKPAMTGLARRKRAPGLLAYVGKEPVGWVAIAPRPELARIEKSKATPRVDDVPVWVIPCITVRPSARGQGVAVELIRAAVAYAASQGAAAVEAYPRASNARIEDDLAFFGTERMFERAGFRVIAPPRRGLPKSWAPRVTMRVDCG
jgi:GNAT superfamily N-acetyltransferase